MKRAIIYLTFIILLAGFSYASTCFYRCVSCGQTRISDCNAGPPPGGICPETDKQHLWILDRRM